MGHGEVGQDLTVVRYTNKIHKKAARVKGK